MRRNDVFQLRIESEEKRRLTEFARRRGLTLSDFIRQSVAEAEHRAAA